METDDSLTRLQGLQADLVAFSESRLPNLERLWTELEASIEDFRKVLDHRPKNDKSRNDIGNDKITIDEEEYGINADFRDQTIQVADELDLDELEAAKLLLQAQSDSSDGARPPAISAIYRYHGHNDALLGALRLVFQHASDQEADFEGKDVLQQVIQVILQQDPDKPPAQSVFWRKCFRDAERLETWVKRLQARLVSMSVIGQTQQSLALEALDFQRTSLLRQHESLTAILCFLVKMEYTSIDDYRTLTQRLASFDAFDDVTVHYMPCLLAFAFSIGSSHGQVTLREARSLDLTFADKTETTRWRIEDFKAAATMIWLAEYSARYADDVASSPLQGVDLAKEAEGRSDRFIECLRQGALQFVLLVYSKIRPQLWHDPAKTGLIGFLVGEARIDRDAPITASPYFDELLSDHLQMFIDALITNMPDTVRRLKYEEDDERRNMGAALTPYDQQTSLHLERFMMLVSYAFSGSGEAAHETFWSDSDGNMYGFLQWASKRQSTPRAAAFCEMFQAIAENEACANAAHRFLMEDPAGASSAKLRRGVTLNWSQIFSELAYYAERLRESPNLLTGVNEPPAAVTTEPESALMLECYLRLTSHLCTNSIEARNFLLNHPDFHIHEVLFDLCRSPIESRFKACAYQVLASLLADRGIDVLYGMWEALDGWVCGTSQPRGGVAKISPTQPTADTAVFARLQPMAVGFEEPNAFIRLLEALITLPAEQDILHDALPFPEQLGSSYRRSGIDQYVDFVLGSVMASVIPTLEKDEYVWELRCACLDFVRVALSSFNEDLVIFANTTNINMDNAMSTSSLETYVKLHPFARVMEWMFNDGVITQLFAASHEDPDVLAGLPADSPKVTAVARAIQVIDLVLRLQATYLDIVRPIIKTKAAMRSRQVANPTLASFEDAILTNLNLVVDLGLYCSTGFEHLTTLSLELLQRLAQSRKLAGTSGSYQDGRWQPSRLVAVLQQSSEVDRIAASFITPLQLDPREIEAGDDAPGHRIKVSVLQLLDTSLEVSSDRPGLAHCLLGFDCTERSIKVAPDSRFATGKSLFHIIAQLYAETASPDMVMQFPPLAAIRSKASTVLQKLFKSPLTSSIVLAELRESGFSEVVAISQTPLLAQFGEEMAAGAAFLASEGAPLLRDRLSERTTYFEHQALELRTAMTAQSATLQTKVRSSLLGLTRLPTGEEIQHANVFDLFDFFDLDFDPPPQIPQMDYMKDLDFETCQREDSAGTASYDIRLVNELLLLRNAELGANNSLVSEEQSNQVQYEMEVVVACLLASNMSSAVKAAQSAATTAWVQLVTVMLSCAGIEDTSRSGFVLRALQIVLPKVEYGLAQELPDILPLVKLLHALVRTNSPSAADSKSATSTVPSDQLIATFRTVLNCITSTVDSLPLRKVAYQTLTRILSSPDTALHRAARKATESSGSRLLDIATEDAFSSDSSTRISALIALQSLVTLFSAQKKPYLIRALSRLNFVQVLVDNIRSIPVSFAEKQSRARLEETVTWINASLAVLVQVAKDSEGASTVLEAGLFSAIREGGLFTADPDVGDDSAEALERFYGLLAGVLRIAGAVVVVKGGRNEAVAGVGRGFLNESRSCFLAVLKAAKRDVGLSVGVKDALGKVLDGFQVVVWATGWLEDEANKPAARKGNLTFT